MRRSIVVLSAGAAILAASACGTTSSPATVTVTAPPAATAVTTAVPAPPASETTSEPAPVESTSTDEATIVVPNGIGKNYQLAQDLWRQAGLVVMPATDALGLNRLPVIDSNWVVVAQTPQPGARVPTGSEITATVKKYTDS